MEILYLISDVFYMWLSTLLFLQTVCGVLCKNYLSIQMIHLVLLENNATENI